MKRIVSMVAAMAVVSSMALGASAALEVIPDGWVFDPEYYAAQNPDVVQVVGTDTMALYNHYRQSGNKEGRKPYDENVYSEDDVKRFYAENFKRSDAQPIEIERVIFTVNSAGGVSPIVLWNNNTGKTIKYIRFYMEPYNAVDDPVEDQTVVIVMIAQVDEIVNALGCLLGIQLALDDAAVFHSDLKSRVHWIISPS